MRLSISLCAAACLAIGCGGNVVVDHGGSGGSGGARGTGGTSAQVGSSSSSGISCSALLTDLQQKLAAAAACSPTSQLVQCDGSASVPDECECQILVNEKNPPAVAAARAAHDAAAAAGCLLGCGKTCEPFGAGFCQPTPDGTTGVCQVALPD